MKIANSLLSLQARENATILYAHHLIDRQIHACVIFDLIKLIFPAHKSPCNNNIFAPLYIIHSYIPPHTAILEPTSLLGWAPSIILINDYSPLLIIVIITSNFDLALPRNRARVRKHAPATICGSLFFSKFCWDFLGKVQHSSSFYEVFLDRLVQKHTHPIGEQYYSLEKRRNGKWET